MPIIKVRETEPFDIALRRFKRLCEKSGIISEARRRESYEKPTTRRKRAKAAAIKRHFKKLSREMPKSITRQKSVKNSKTVVKRSEPRRA